MYGLCVTSGHWGKQILRSTWCPYPDPWFGLSEPSISAWSVVILLALGGEALMSVSCGPLMFWLDAHGGALTADPSSPSLYLS